MFKSIRSFWYRLVAMFSLPYEAAALLGNEERDPALMEERERELITARTSSEEDLALLVAPTVDSVRMELRRAIFLACFHATHAKIIGDAAHKNTCQQGACSFAEFGVLSGLFSTEEGNEWLDVIWEREPMEYMITKYDI